MELLSRTVVSPIRIACTLALLLAAVAAVAEEEADAPIQRAAELLGAGPYRVGFDWSLRAAGGEPSRLIGEAFVEPLADGGSRFRLEASRQGDGAGRLVVVDDGASLEVFDGAAGKAWFSPRYRAAGFLGQRYLGRLLPMALAAERLEGSARYGAERGEPVTASGRRCDTVRIPFPTGAYDLSFDRESGLPCRYAFEVTSEGEEVESVVLISGFERLAEPPELSFDPPANATRAEFTPGGPAPGEGAPATVLELADGGTWRLADRKGRVVLLDFWATWCMPCRSSMKAVQTLLDERPGAAVEAVAVNVMDTGDREAFLAELGIGYPWAGGDAVRSAWGIDQTGLPALFVVGKDGRVEEYFLGAMSEAAHARLAEAVDAALAR